MAPKFAIYLMIAIGCMLLVIIWAWALLDGVNLPQLILAFIASSVLCIGSITIATEIIKRYPVISVENFMLSTAVTAIMSAIAGTFVLIWECIPSGEIDTTDTYLDRRYALLFYAIAAYLIIFPRLSRQKSR